MNTRPNLGAEILKSESDGDAPLELVERLTPSLERRIAISKLVHRERTPRDQEIVVAETPQFGRILIIDGLTQLSSYDQHIYHEALVHPPLITHPSPESVVILGGGDGMAARECLKHKPVQSLVLVDFDERVTEVCKTFFSMEETFQDSRLRRVVAGAWDFLEADPRCDVLIVDVTDADDPHSAKVFSERFYRMAREAVGDGGVLGIQTGSPPFLDNRTYRQQESALKAVFGNVDTYYAYVPSFSSAWGFAAASERHTIREIGETEVARRLVDRGVDTCFYDPTVHVYLSKMRTEIG